jgi:hypothetical protein
MCSRLDVAGRARFVIRIEDSNVPIVNKEGSSTAAHDLDLISTSPTGLTSF